MLHWSNLAYRMDPIRFVREQLHFDPDPTQQTVIESCHPRGLLNCTRQWGKSTVTAAKAIHRAATVPGSLTVVMSPSNRQSGEFLAKARAFVAHMGSKPRGDGHNPVSLLLPNGSRIVGVPDVEATTRGFSGVSLLLVDEAAWVDDAAYQAMTAVLAASNGHQWLMSTPAGRRGFFYRAWEFGGDDWIRISVQATSCPRISLAFLDLERRQKSAALYEQEYMCSFVRSEGALFDPAIIDRAFTTAVPPLVAHHSGGTSRDIVAASRSLYVGLDLGRSPDRTALVAVELIQEHDGSRDPVTWAHTTCSWYAVTHIEQFREGVSYSEVADRVAALMKRDELRPISSTSRCELVVDATGVGAAVVEMLSTALYRSTPRPAPCLLTKVVITGGETEGMNNGAWHVPKTNLIAALEVLLDREALKVSTAPPDSELLRKQLRDLRATPARDGRSYRYAAPNSEHDDIALALALACWRARRLDRLPL
jgi:hypothetical protein